MRLDHLAVAGQSLEEAVDHVQSALGVALQPGGQHARFGTHNRLLGLEDGLYLEAIAIDPDAPNPDRPRWFDLDSFAGPPRITNWICASDDLTGALRGLPEGAGEPVDLARGDLRWKMAVPASGKLPYAGAFPALIEWTQGGHPATRLPVSGCRLRMLVIAHPDAEALSDMLLPRLSDPRIRFENGPLQAFRAEFDTPSGRRVLQ